MLGTEELSMDTITSIVTALAVGAVAVHQSPAGRMVKWRYARLKRPIHRRYPQVDIDKLESNPRSKAVQAMADEGLRAARADWDIDVLLRARRRLKAIQREGPAVAAAISKDLKEIKGASLSLEEVTNFRSMPARTSEDISIPGRNIVIKGYSFHIDSNLTIRRTSRGKFDTAPLIVRNEIDCTAFAPQRVALGQQALIQVFVQTADDIRELEATAKAADPETSRRGATILSTEIAQGSRLTFTLNIPGLLIDEPVQEIIWRGTMVCVQFSVTAPQQLRYRSLRSRTADTCSGNRICISGRCRHWAHQVCPAD
jgi:hypothetical protein